MLHVEWWQSGPHVCKVYGVLMEEMSEGNLATNRKCQIKPLKFKQPFY